MSEMLRDILQTRYENIAEAHCRSSRRLFSASTIPYAITMRLRDTDDII